MQAANRLQRALHTGSGLTFGAWQMLPGSNQARTIARCGFDWVLVDTEHGNIDGTIPNPSLKIGSNHKRFKDANSITFKMGKCMRRSQQLPPVA